MNRMHLATVWILSTIQIIIIDLILGLKINGEHEIVSINSINGC